MLQFNYPPQAIFPLTLEEAFRRIVDKPEIDIMFQPEVGNVSNMYTALRIEIEFLLESTPLIEETGIFGQRLNMGVMFFIRHPKLGPGWMFVQTKPEEQLSDEDILTREKRGNDAKRTAAQ